MSSNFCESDYVIRNHPFTESGECRCCSGLPSPRRAHQGDGVIINRDGTGMQWDNTAQVQQETKNWPRDIYACILNGQIVGPVRIDFASAPVKYECRTVTVGQSEVFPTSKRLDAQ